MRLINPSLVFELYQYLMMMWVQTCLCHIVLVYFEDYKAFRALFQIVIHCSMFNVCMPFVDVVNWQSIQRVRANLFNC